MKDEGDDRRRTSCLVHRAAHPELTRGQWGITADVIWTLNVAAKPRIVPRRSLSRHEELEG